MIKLAYETYYQSGDNIGLDRIIFEGFSKTWIKEVVTQQIYSEALKIEKLLLKVEKYVEKVDKKFTLRIVKSVKSLKIGIS